MVQRLLQMGPLLPLGPNVITGGTFMVQRLLQMGPLLHLGPKVIIDGAFITLGSTGPKRNKGPICYYRWDLYYAWVQTLSQMGPLLHLGPKVITDGIYYAWVHLSHLCLLHATPLDMVCQRPSTFVRHITY